MGGFGFHNVVCRDSPDSERQLLEQLTKQRKTLLAG